MTILLLASGKIKGSEFENISSLYRKRILWPLTIHEIQIKKPLKGQLLRKEEADLFLLHIQQNDFVITCDEKGENLESQKLATKFTQIRENVLGKVIFLIGGADGLHETILNRADLSIAFGKQTWPHLMVRVMLLEQIYRIQQILAGHPYHRA